MQERRTQRAKLWWRVGSERVAGGEKRGDGVSACMRRGALRDDGGGRRRAGEQRKKNKFSFGFCETRADWSVGWNVHGRKT